VIEQIQTGSFSILQEYIQKTPEGILTMMQIKGIGPKNCNHLKELKMKLLVNYYTPVKK
jgi:DNA polymerase (family 10)